MSHELTAFLHSKVIFRFVAPVNVNDLKRTGELTLEIFEIIKSTDKNVILRNKTSYLTSFARYMCAFSLQRTCQISEILSKTCCSDVVCGQTILRGKRNSL